MNNGEHLLPSELRDSVKRSMEALKAVLDDPETTKSLAETTNQRLDRIRGLRDYLVNPSFCIAFLGQIGVGKSSVISVLSKLLIGPDPRNRKELKASSVLAVGSGGTTVCEVRVRQSGEAESGQIGLLIDPCPCDYPYLRTPRRPGAWTQPA